MRARPPFVQSLTFHFPSAHTHTLHNQLPPGRHLQPMGNKCYSNTACPDQTPARAVYKTSLSACQGDTISGAPYYIYNGAITDGTTPNCFNYAACTPQYVPNAESSLSVYNVGCPALPSQVCSLAPGWQCFGSAASGISSSFEACTTTCQDLSMDFTFVTFNPAQSCECYSSTTCSSLKYTAGSTSGTVRYAYVNAPICPLVQLEGATLLGDGQICTPETAIYPSGERRERNLGSGPAPNETPEACFTFCLTAGTTHFNFYPDLRSGGIGTACSCSASCATTQAVSGALRYSITTPIPPLPPIPAATDVPSQAPSQAPSQVPTGLPSLAPTPSPTNFPTFVPPLPTDPVQAVATNKVCGPAVRRLMNTGAAGRGVPSLCVASLHRQLFALPIQSSTYSPTCMANVRMISSRLPSDASLPKRAKTWLPPAAAPPARTGN